jgi:NADPH-dependent 2,4-dienoyl-CoA reductase/sulfur reductase-like enzyme
MRPSEFYEKERIDVRLGTRVTSIDPRSKQLELASGAKLAFDGLLLATGAVPIRLSIPGSDLPHVHYVRTLADSRAIIARLERARRAVVLGASFIGLETAAALRTRGLDVVVVAPAPPLERVLGPELGGFLKALHEERGVRFQLGLTASQITQAEVVLSDGSALGADLVVAGIGVTPALDLAEKAGLALERGVLVNEFLETSSPGIYAAGDIARYPDPHTQKLQRIEHWVVAQRQGRAAARNLLGFREPFKDVPFFWSQHYDVAVNYVGHAEHWDTVEVHGSPKNRDCLVAYREASRIAAIATIGRDRASLDAELAFKEGNARRLEAIVAAS